MAFNSPSVADFKSYFVRDFPYGTDIRTSVLDSDITNAFLMTNTQINQSLFSYQSDYNIGYLLLAAHYMVMSLRASTQGINGQFAWLESGKAVGPASSTLSIPQQILNSPYWSALTKTNYGAEYLMMVFPKTVGSMFTVCGATLP